MYVYAYIIKPVLPPFSSITPPEACFPKAINKKSQIF